MITVYWTAGTTGSMTLLWHCDVRCLHLNDRDVVRLMNYLLINEWVVTHTIRPVRERGEREVRLLWYPRYCLVQTLHNISLTLVCWVIATSNHQTFEVTARVSWCLISLGSLNLPFSSAMLFARLPVPNILLFAIVVITGTLSKTC